MDLSVKTYKHAYTRTHTNTHIHTFIQTYTHIYFNTYVQKYSLFISLKVLAGKFRRTRGTKPVPLPFCTPQISRGMNCHESRASAMRGGRLTD